LCFVFYFSVFLCSINLSLSLTFSLKLGNALSILFGLLTESIMYCTSRSLLSCLCDSDTSVVWCIVPLYVLRNLRILEWALIYFSSSSHGVLS
jgi:hypothetical protein